MGYLTFQTTANVKDIRGMMFVNTSDEPLDVQAVVPDAVNVSANDTLQIYNPSTKKYNNLMWKTDTKIGSTWTGKPGWANALNVRQTAQLDPGQGFWLLTKNACTVTIAGQVVAVDENKRSIAAGVKDIFANVFPTAINIQDIIPSDPTANDTLQIYNPSTKKYNNLMWKTDTKVGSTWTGKPGWANALNLRQDITLDPGQGVWLQTKNACDITFKAPF